MSKETDRQKELGQPVDGAPRPGETHLETARRRQDEKRRISEERGGLPFHPRED